MKKIKESERQCALWAWVVAQASGRMARKYGRPGDSQNPQPLAVRTSTEVVDVVQRKRRLHLDPNVPVASIPFAISLGLSICF